MRDEELSFPIGVPGQEEGRSRQAWWQPVLQFLGLIWAFATVGAMILVPNLPHHGCGGQLTACKSNCKNLATALEMYASDFGGHYPPSLQQLTAGNYLKTLPTCPTAGAMTYFNYRVVQNPDQFSFACVGDNHARSYTGYLPASSRNYPRYHSELGLIDHP